MRFCLIWPTGVDFVGWHCSVWWVLLDNIFGRGGDFGVAFIGWGFGVSSIRIIFAGFLFFDECMGVFVIAALVFVPFWLHHFHLD